MSLHNRLGHEGLSGPHLPADEQGILAVESPDAACDYVLLCHERGPQEIRTD
jgi:hypothetical protein